MKEYSDIASAEEMVKSIAEGKYNVSAAIRELKYIIGEWPGTRVAKEAERLLEKLLDE